MVELGHEAVAQLVDRNGKAYGEHQTQRHEHQVITEGVADDHPSVRRVEDELEVGESNPFILYEQTVDELVLDPIILRGFRQLITLEGEDDGRHGHVAETEQKYASGKQHRQECKMPFDFTGSPLSVFQGFRRAGGQCSFSSHCYSSCSKVMTLPYSNAETASCIA